MEPETGIDTLSPEEQAYFNAGDAAHADEAPDSQATETTGSHDEPAKADDGTDAAAKVAATDKKGADNKPKMVPHAALHEERTKRQKLEAELVEQRRQRDVLDQRTAAILERLTQAQEPKKPEPAEVKIPSLEEDPIGHFKAISEQQAKRLAELEQRGQQSTEAQRQLQAASHVLANAQAQESAFKASTPDYDEAADYLVNIEQQELALQGYSAPEIQVLMTRKRLELAARAAQLGKNPAELVYQASKLRGFTGKKAAIAANGSGDPAGDAVRAAAAASGGKPPSDAERLVSIAKAQDENASLSRGNGHAPVPLTAQRLVEMSDSDFAKMMDTPEGLALLGR